MKNLRVRDLYELEEIFYNMIKKYNPPYSKDIVQDLYVYLLGVESREGSLNRIRYKDTVNLYYIYKTIGHLCLKQLREEGRYVPLTDREYNISEDEVDVIDNKLPSQLFMSFVFKRSTPKELSKKYNIGLSTVYKYIAEERARLRELGDKLYIQ